MGESKSTRAANCFVLLPTRWARREIVVEQLVDNWRRRVMGVARTVVGGSMRGL